MSDLYPDHSQDWYPPRRRAAVLSYDARHGDAPRVVAKGYGTLAETIVARAREAGLYVHVAPGMVDLLMQVDLDARIPPALYRAVAELLAWLYALEVSAERDGNQDAPGAAPALWPKMRDGAIRSRNGPG